MRTAILIACAAVLLFAQIPSSNSGGGTPLGGTGLSASGWTVSADFSVLPRFLNYQKAATGVTLTGGADTLYTYTVPGGTLGAGQCILVNAAAQKSSGGNSTTYTLSYGGTGITIASTSNAIATWEVLICNNASVTNAQQITGLRNQIGSGSVSTTTATAAIDSTANQTLLFTATGTAADVVTPTVFLVTAP